MEEKVVKGYKVFKPDWTCRPEGKIFQYEVGKTYEENVKPKVYNCGFHFCEKAVDCFNFCKFNPKNKVAEVLALGEIDSDGTKSCTNKIQILREIPWSELLEIVNTGRRGNSGNRNSGYRNSGDYNSGYRNSGNRNSGYRNSGNYNSGDHNSGNRNSGYRNSGDYNSGYRNSGYRNSGYRNSGNYNSGNYNSGNYNSSNYNIGYYNSGDYNGGNYNSGYYNSGDYNSGNYNSGDCNSGYYNKCNFSNGCFNTVGGKRIYMFNKLSEWTFFDWLKSEACKLLDKVKPNIAFIEFRNMTDEEKALHPEAETTGGYLKTQNDNQNYIDWWYKLNDEQKAVITALPNFDKDIFKEITGIDVDKD